ncbi:MAG: hypothetical protein LBU81_04135 [Methanosarcinales archaeon]|jgi:hypothetical protein|nr:hypothetical protein [Methanosarcinales archaeon]
MNLKVLFIAVFFLLNNAAASEDFVSSSLSLAVPEYYIRSADDLKSIEYQSNVSSYFHLMNDIDITDEIWNPIGSANRPFSGTFYGNNHTITFTGNSELMQPAGFENEGCGLFGNIYSGKIYDLNLVLQGNLTSNEKNTGTFAGIVNGNYSSQWHSSAFINCSVSAKNASVSGLNNVGGFVGYIVNASVENCSSDCSVISKGYNAGGLAGAVFNGTFAHSSAAGSVESAGTAGGFIGSLRLGNISNSSATGSVKSESSAGGLIGYISAETVISDSAADGTVEPGGVFGNFIGGWDENYKPEIINCFYQGKKVDLKPVPAADYSSTYLMAGVVLIILIAAAAIIYFKMNYGSR